MKRWYVVHTLARSEMKAYEQLTLQGYTVFLPRYQHARRHARKVDMVLSPLFTRYLFIEMDLMKDRWAPIDSTQGVAYILRQNGLPMAVPNEVIEKLKLQADIKELVPLSALELFVKGSLVEIVEGPFIGQIGEYEKMTADSRVRLLLSLLGHRVAVDVPVHAVAEVS